MGMWANAAKKATSFGVKGFIYGAAIGAVVAVAALTMGAAIYYGIGVSELVAQEAAKATTMGMLDNAIQLMSAGVKSLTFENFATFAGLGAFAGSGVGAISGATVGAVYGAATDESNPNPQLVNKTARNISEKVPTLAKAIAREVEEKDSVNRIRSQIAPQPAAALNEAPKLAQPVNEQATQTTTRFQDRLSVQALEAELSAGPRSAG